MMDCMMGRMFPSSPPPSPPSSNPRPSRALTRSSPASPEDCKGKILLVICLHHSKQVRNNWSSLIWPTCRLSAFLARPRRVSLRQEVNSCWEAVSVPTQKAQITFRLEEHYTEEHIKTTINANCRPYQLCLQPLTVFGSAAAVLAPPGPAQSWPSPTHPWLGQPCRPRKESRRVCSLQAEAATQVNRKHVRCLLDTLGKSVSTKMYQAYF